MKSVIKNGGMTASCCYPCLKYYGNTNEFYVVLFTAPQKGMVVFSAYPDFYVGDNGTANNAIQWAEEQFMPFNGTIELTNN